MQILETPSGRFEVQSDSGNTYVVQFRGSGDGDPDIVRLWDCTCPAGQYGKMCRHVRAVADYMDAGEEG